MDVEDILSQIDHAIGDDAIGDDAMRWKPCNEDEQTVYANSSTGTVEHYMTVSTTNAFVESEAVYWADYPHTVRPRYPGAVNASWLRDQILRYINGDLPRS